MENAGGGGNSASEVYYAQRRERVAQLKERGDTVYPHKFHVSASLAEIRKKWGEINAGQHIEGEVIRVAGRITAVRIASKKLIFYDIQQGGSKLQVLANYNSYEEKERGKFVDLTETTLRRGDVVGVRGHPACSKSGELSVLALEITLLAPCLRVLPLPGTLSDTETRQRERHLDLIVNGADVFVTRSRILQFIRRFFGERGFLEVETPTMSLLPGGANAKPFVTYHNDLGMSMFMRVAPELFLKQLVIGGLDRVFEIGRNYRNEGFDATHNPEFTAIESYEAYADYNDLMRMTEELLSSMVLELFGRYVITYQGKEIDFTPPFRRVPLVATLEEKLDVRPLPIEDAGALKAILDQHQVECSPPHTVPRLLDALVGEFIEPELRDPAFITDHPQIMCPLAKYHRDDPRLSERFELFVGGLELCNAYTELNDPEVQRRLFREQQKDMDAGDDEAMPVDEGFCRAMDYGLPPTGGWGMGIDRLVMFLTNQSSIKDVILYPAARPTEQERQAQRQLRRLLQEAARGASEATE